MDDAVLNFCFRKYGFNRIGKSVQVVNAGNENVLNTPVSQAVEHCSPELGALVFTYPHAQYVFPPVQLISWDCYVHVPEAGAQRLAAIYVPAFDNVRVSIH